MGVKVIEDASARTTFDVMSCYYVCHARVSRITKTVTQIFNNSIISKKKKKKKMLILQVLNYAVHYLQARCVCVHCNDEGVYEGESVSCLNDIYDCFMNVILEAINFSV